MKKKSGPAIRPAIKAYTAVRPYEPLLNPDGPMSQSRQKTGFYR